MSPKCVVCGKRIFKGETWGHTAVGHRPAHAIHFNCIQCLSRRPYGRYHEEDSDEVTYRRNRECEDFSLACAGCGCSLDPMFAARMPPLCEDCYEDEHEEDW